MPSNIFTPTYIMEKETREIQLRRAYSIDLKLKNQFRRKRFIYVKIEKQEINTDIVMQFAEDIHLER